MNTNKLTVRLIALILIGLLYACGGGGGNPAPSSKTHTVTGLSPGTQYYWKVTATDFIDNTDSEVRNFTTL